MPTDPERVARAVARRFSVGPDEVQSVKEALIARGLMWSAEPRPNWLPDAIHRSWRRSISSGATRRPGTFRYVNAVDSGSELCRAACPVLTRLEATLQDMGVSIFLADGTGQIVARRVTGRSERARFDGACAAEGFDFSEECIGTNGLGTPIEDGAAVFVRGAEHFNDALKELACAGMGIRHPGTGRMVGSLSLSAPAATAEMLMLALVREGAQQIVDNLGASASRRETALGRSYRQHRTKGPVIVLNCDTVMTNVTGLSFLSVESHARLWDLLLSQDWANGPHVLDVDLQALQARVLAHRLAAPDDEPSFAVEILDRLAPAGPVRCCTGVRPTGQELTRDPYVAQLQRISANRTGACVVSGPGGAGKLHVVREWLRLEGHPAPIVLESGELQGRGSWRATVRSALDAGGAVVLRRVEDLDPHQVNAVKVLADHLQSVARPIAPGPGDATPVRAPSRLAMTADLSRCDPPVRGALCQIAVRVDLPALAHRRQDIPALAETLIQQVAPDQRPVLSAAAVQALMRWDWPGNLAELRRVLTDLSRDRPGQVVSRYHLPEYMWGAASRRTLSRMESAEREEILAALHQAGGNRSQASELLGIGRTTLYRKLHALGIGQDSLSV